MNTTSIVHCSEGKSSERECFCYPTRNLATARNAKAFIKEKKKKNYTPGHNICARYIRKIRSGTY